MVWFGLAWFDWLVWFGWFGLVGLVGWFGWLGWLGLAVDFQQSVPFLKKKELTNLQHLLDPKHHFIVVGDKAGVRKMNQTNSETAYLLRIAGQAAEITSLPHSIQTLVVE